MKKDPVKTAQEILKAFGGKETASERKRRAGGT